MMQALANTPDQDTRVAFVPLTNPQLRTRIHNHADLADERCAMRIRAGTLDICLLKEAGLQVNPELEKAPDVTVVFDHMHLNAMLVRGDPVYRVYVPASNAFIGHYAAAAFSKLVA